MVHTRIHKHSFVSGPCVLMVHTVIMFDLLFCETQTDWLIWLRPL